MINKPVVKSIINFFILQKCNNHTHYCINRRLIYILGNATDEEILLRANLPTSKGILIFAEERMQTNDSIKDSLFVDGKTLLVITAITLMKERMNLPVPIIAEVTSDKHIQLFKDVKVDEFFLIQGIISNKILQSLFPA